MYPFSATLAFHEPVTGLVCAACELPSSRSPYSTDCSIDMSKSKLLWMGSLRALTLKVCRVCRYFCDIMLLFGVGGERIKLEE